MNHERSIEEWLRAALDAGPESFALHRIVRDEAGAFQDLESVYQSAAAARMSGLGSQALVGKRILQLFPSHLGSATWEGYRHVVETGETLHHEVSYVGEGIEGWFETTAVRVEGQYLAISGRDVTKRKRAQDALRATRRCSISVEDLGVGFDARDEVLWTTGGGFGLLSVREQLRRLGGAVEVASAKGGGTRVSLYVPRKKEAR